jgi:uncharacterized MAPEG superfamily protein
MTIPFWCVIIVAFLPYLLAGIGLYFRITRLGGWDNDNPRAQYAKLEGAGWRAWSAQLNAWEALGLFTAVVVIAHLAGADPEKSALAAQVFVLTRLIHPVLYMANLATLRSIAVVTGLMSCGYLVYLSANAGLA